MRERSSLLLTALALCLVLWLILGLWPLSMTTRWLLSFLALVIGSVMLWRQWQSQLSRGEVLKRGGATHLPPEGFQGAVLLVVGDTRSWFLPGQSFRETRQGWYLQVENPEQLPILAEQLATLRPALVPCVAVMLALLPGQHTSDEAFGQALRAWQRAVVQCCTWLNGLPPLLVSLMVSAAPDVNAEDEAGAHWFTVTPDLPGIQVRLPDQGAIPVADWLRNSTATVRLPRLSQALWLQGAQAWYQQSVHMRLNVRQGDLPALCPVALGYCLTPIETKADNLWQQHITTLTALPPATEHRQDLLPLPDMLLNGVMCRRGVGHRIQLLHKAGLMSGVFLLLALLASFINNQRLVRSVGDHLALYHRLDGEPPRPKVAAQQRLRADSHLLDDWLRRGEPLRYGWGLYQGLRLIAPVEAALSDWAPQIPPRPVTHNQVQEPQTVRLDSLSLFDSGKSLLKPDSTKVLINALVGIKAKPGWLIVVSGHTDNTGDPQLNQTLSLQRADAVRDWMRDTGDLPESCFAVQGYGDSRPVATNHTPEGRALNRRVEISLVPQADACRLPGIPPAPSTEDGASLTEMEK